MAKENLEVRVAAILDDISDHIVGTRLEKAQEAGVEGNSLPKKGTFGTYKKAGSVVGTGDDANDFRHLRMTVKGKNDSVSTANIKIVAPRKKDKIEFGTINKKGSAMDGRKYLKGKTVNPKFAQYSTLELIAFLEGKDFEAKEIGVWSLPYKPAGWEEPTEDDLVLKTAYEIEITE